ncbi:MAG TPA: hypothetical protein VGF11_00945 [Acidimicrobiales bacterium]
MSTHLFDPEFLAHVEEQRTYNATLMAMTVAFRPDADNELDQPRVLTRP